MGHFVSIGFESALSRGSHRLCIHNSMALMHLRDLYWMLQKSLNHKLCSKASAMHGREVIRPGESEGDPGHAAA